MERRRGQALRVLGWRRPRSAARGSRRGAGAEAKLKAEIIRSKGGIPTIRADDFKGLGFGYGYAFAEDNICTIAEAYVTVERRALALLRPRRPTRPTGYTNLQSDLFYQRIKDARDHRQGARRAAAGRARRRRSTRRSRATSPATTATSTRPGSTTSPIRPAPARPGSATSPPPTSGGASTSSASSPAGQVAEDGIADARRRRRAAAARRRALPARRRATSPRSARRSTPPRRHRLERLGPRQRGDRERQRHGARQPALPLAGLRALLPVAPRGPGQGQRLRRQPLRRPGDQHRPHRAPRLDAHGLDRLPVRARSSSPSCPATRPATWSTASRRRCRPPTSPCRRCSPTARSPRSRGRSTRPATGRSSPRSRASRCSTGRRRTAYAMYDANADNLRYVNHFLDTNRAQSTNELLDDAASKYEGIPWVNTMAVGLARQGALRRHRLDPERPQREGDRLLPGAARGADLPGARAADPRRLALGVRAGHRPRLGRARDLRRPRACRTCSGATTSRTPTTPTGSRTPSSRWRASRGSSATRRTPRSLRTRLGLKMLEQRLSRHRRLRRRQVQPQQAAADRVQRPPLRRRALPLDAGGVLPREPDPRPAPTARSTSATACPALDGFDEKQNLDSTGAILFRRFMSKLGAPPVHDARSTSPTRSTRRPGSTPPTRRSARRSPTRSPTCSDAGIPFDAPLGDYQYETARQREHPDPRRPRRPGRLQRDHRPLAAPGRLPGRHRRLELHHGRRLRQGRQGVSCATARSSPTRSRRTRTPSTPPTRRGCSRRRSGSTRRSAAARWSEAAKSTKVIRGG